MLSGVSIIIIIIIVLVLVYLYYATIDIDNNRVGDTYDIFTDVFAQFKTDVTGAWYNGDYAQSLNEAQQQKYNVVLDFLQVKKGDIVLDIGCGWGYLVEEINKRGAHGIGLTLSRGQANEGIKRGLDLRVINWKDIDAQTFGKVDHIVSIGAFEHFANLDECYKKNTQNDVYNKYFELCYNLLKENGKMYLQTMVFTKKGDEITQRLAFDIDSGVNSSPGSDDHIMALLSYFYPNSCLPKGFDQIKETSEPYFEVAYHNSGRKDYIVTLNEWGKLMDNMPTSTKIWLYAKYIPLILSHKKMYLMYQSFCYSAQTEVFKRELFEHERIFFIKRSKKNQQNGINN